MTVFRYCALLVLLLISSAAFADDDSAILLPLGLVHVSGAFGSVWETELVVKNVSHQPVQLFTPADGCFDTFTCQFGSLTVEPGRSIVLSDPTNGSRLASPSGIIVRPYGQGVSAADFRFNFRVRDLSRQMFTWGTELPVVMSSEFTSGPIELLNIPVASEFRFTVRVYSIEGSDLRAILATARVFELASGSTLKQLSLSLIPRAGPSIYYPAYAQLDSMAAELSNLPAGRIGIEITSDNSADKLWAFATVTNNETQDVTTITP